MESRGRRLLVSWLLSALCERGVDPWRRRPARAPARVERPLSRQELQALLGPCSRLRLFPLQRPRRRAEQP